MFLRYGIYPYAMMFSFKKANYHYPWIAFIPIVNYWGYLKVIRLNRGHILWMLLPGVLMPFQNSGIVMAIFGLIANILVTIIGIWWSVRYYKAFGMNPHRLWRILFPVVGIVLIIIFQSQIGFSKKIPI